ncbi:hypothetical protein ALC56_05460, partial [Trachymyrmex septentrionalis]
SSNCRQENSGLILILYKNLRRDTKLDFANRLYEKRRGVTLHDKNNFDFPSQIFDCSSLFLVTLAYPQCQYRISTVKNDIYPKVAPPVPDAASRPPPPLRIGLTSSRTGHSRKTLANNTLYKRARTIHL